MQELPLVIFTLCEGLAIGAITCMVIFELAKKEIANSTKFRIALIAFIIGAVGMCASLFHLGQPLRAFNALRGFSTSWLSREIVFFALFVLFTLVYTILAKTGKQTKAVGIIAAILGIASLVITSACYMMPGIPFWNTILTPIMFFVCAAASGYSFYAMMAKQAAKADDFKKWLIIFIIIVIIAAVWRFLFYSNATLLVFSC